MAEREVHNVAADQQARRVMEDVADRQRKFLQIYSYKLHTIRLHFLYNLKVINNIAAGSPEEAQEAQAAQDPQQNPGRALNVDDWQLTESQWQAASDIARALGY